MSTNMPPYMSSVQTQLASIMDVLARAAVAEISQLFSESSADLRLEVSRSIKENEMLRMRMKVMKSELFALRIQRANTPRVGRFSLSRALCRPRSKLAVIDRTDRRGSSEVDCSITTTEERRNLLITPTVQIESAEVENNCPDVILIKDEEGPDNYFGEHQLHSDQDHTPDADEGAESVAMATPELDPASVMLHHGGPCIVSIHGGEEEEGVRDPEQPDPQDPSPFTDPPDLQGFPTLTCSLPGSHGSQTSLGPRAAGRAVVGRAQGGGEAHGRGGSLDIVQATTTLATSAAMNPTAPNLARYGGWRLGQDLIQPQPQPQSQRSPPPHSHTPLVCSFCDKRFYRRSDLARHRALHTGETPTTCALCGKQFVNKTTLNVHMRIHTGEKPYTCTLCGKSFTQNGSLTIHLRTHSGEKPYSCTLCGASFNNPSNLRRHMVTHQDGPAPDSLTSQGLR